MKIIVDDKELIEYAERYMNNEKRRKAIEKEVRKMERCTPKKLWKMLERLEKGENN